MKLGTHIQGPNTNTPAKFQGHSFIITPSLLTRVTFKVIEPEMETWLFIPMINL